jgi:hypothetical protein
MSFISSWALDDVEAPGLPPRVVGNDAFFEKEEDPLNSFWQVISKSLMVKGRGFDSNKYSGRYRAVCGQLEFVLSFLFERQRIGNCAE